MNTEVFYLSEYNWERGVLISEGTKNYKIQPMNTMLTHVRIPKAKCSRLGENVCIVWETWKGANGRGSYRVERELYPQHRIPAEKVARQSIGQGRVTETAYGVKQ